MEPTLPPGWTVRYRHQRMYKGRAMTALSWTQPVSLSGFVWRALPKGGATLADVFNADGEHVATGLARVHPNDNFNRRIGRRIALGRALYAAGAHPRAQRELPGSYYITPAAAKALDRELARAAADALAPLGASAGIGIVPGGWFAKRLEESLNEPNEEGKL